DAVLLIDLGGRHGDAGIEMADHELHAVADELVGDRDAFFRIGAIVADEKLNLLSENAAGGVDVLDRLLDPVLELRAEGGAAAGDRSGHPQFDLRRGAVRESEAKREGEAKREPLFHRVHLWMTGSSCARLLWCAPFMARLKRQTKEKSPGFWRVRRRRIVAAAPAQRARALVDPFVAGDHLGHPREAESEQAEREADGVVHQIIV